MAFHTRLHILFIVNRYLENEGIEYLRTYLHLPSEIVPSTLKRAARTETARARPSAAPRTGDSKAGTDRQQYRRAPLDGADKKADVGPGAADVEFVSVSCAQRVSHSPTLARSDDFNVVCTFLFHSNSTVDSDAAQNHNKLIDRHSNKNIARSHVKIKIYF